MSLDTLPLAPPKDRNGDSTPGHEEARPDRDERAVLMETEPAPRPAERRLHIETPDEPPAYRGLFLLVALALVGLHLAFSHAYWAPGHYGNNQNAYLAAGKLLATTGTTGFEPASPFQFVGWMWNMADGASTAPGGGWHYPKYPAGLPLINALVYTAGKTITGDPWTGIAWTFKVSPVSVALSTLAIFFITRLLAGSFPAVLAMIAFSTLTVVIVLTNNPNSHAPDMAFVTWGMYAVLKWWQRGGWWRGAIAGFLIGYAATIRYTEGLLVLPLLAAVVGSVRWRDLRSWARVSVPLVAWAFPLGVLVIFNLLTVGSLTGYDSTNESTGFTLAELQRKWRWGIDQFYNTGLYVLLPLAVGGMLMAFRWNWRVAVLLVLWFVPGTVLYLTYYWGMNLPVWGFLRFFASVLPAGVIAAVWMMQRAAASNAPAVVLPAWSVRRGLLVTLLTLAAGAGAFGLGYLAIDRADAGERFWAFCALAGVAGAIATAGACGAGRGVAPSLAMGTLVAFPAAINVDVSRGPLERDHIIATNLSVTAIHIRSVAPRGSVVFGNSQFLHNYLQFAGDDYTLYGSDYFLGGRPVPGIRGGPDGDTPNPIQPERKSFVDRIYQQYDRPARVAEAARLATMAFANGQRVFVASEVGSGSSLIEELEKTGTVRSQVVASWVDPARMSGVALSTLATIGRDGFARREPWQWKVYELTAAPPGSTTAPATAPTDARAAAPATGPAAAASPVVMGPRRGVAIPATAATTAPSTRPAGD